MRWWLSAVLILLAGCGGGGEETAPAPTPAPEAERPPELRRAPLRRATCRSAAPTCRAAAGRIVYVEAVDPDGDGDAHFVLAGRGSVTGPGITVVDVRRRLRPRPLPKVGDRMSAAGPVFTGSYGQRQIEAVEVHVQRR